MGKTVFTDGNVLTKTSGLRVLAAWLNKVFNHRHDGKDQDGSGPLDFAVDVGEVNALVVVMNPPLTEHVKGFPIYVQVANTNTGAVTIEVDELAPVSVHKHNDQDFDSGDLVADQMICVMWDGAAYQIIGALGNSDAATLNGQTAHQLVPPGIKGEFFMPSIPDGWLLADGRAVLRAAYPALYDAIGTTHGAGDGVTTFNLPEGRGEFFRGWDNGRGVDPDREFGSFQDDMVGPHSHTYDKPTAVAWFDHQSGSGLEGFAEATTVANNGTESRPRNLAVLVCIKY